MARIGLAIGGAVLIGGALLAWGLSSDETSATTLNGIKGIELRKGSGNVEIHRGAVPATQVDETVDRWFGGFGASDPRHRVVDGKLILDTNCGWDCDVSYVVTLPEGVPVVGELGSGDLSVRGVTSLNADVGSGAVRVDDVEGRVRAYTDSGDINATGLGGDADLHSGSGSIDLRNVGGNLRAQTDSGDIRAASVGGNADLDTGSGNIDATKVAGTSVRGHTDSGDVKIAMTNPTRAELDSGSGRVHAIVPNGSYRVQANSGDGDQRIGVRSDPGAERVLKLVTDDGDVQVDAA